MELEKPFHQRADWTTPEDFAPFGWSWQDITHAGSEHEIQMCVAGDGMAHGARFRHRSLIPGSPWVRGEPSKDKS